MAAPIPHPFIEALERALSSGSVSRAELEAAAAGLPEGERALALKLAALADERALWRAGLLQTAKLSEVGMAMAQLVHELRNPLSGISGFAQLLTSDPRSAEAPSWVREIAAQAARMEQLIERMRRFIKPAGEELGPLDLEAALKAAAAVVPRMPPGVKLELEIAPELPRVRAEAQALEQVVVNLLANAREAMEEHGRPGTVLLRAWVSGAQVEILVADQGPGIPAEIASRVFEPFATSKGEYGTGLGLYICREILRGWGGSIRVIDPAPAPYRTAFSVRLPALPAAPAHAPSVLKPAEADHALRQLLREIADGVGAATVRRRVLIVDDEPAVRRAVRVLLAHPAELEPVEASDGPAAMQLLAEAPAQVAIVDKNLPAVSGLELLRWAAARDLRLESIVITGYPSLGSAIDAIELGACDYLVKPLVKVDELRERVGQALERQRLRQIAKAVDGNLRLWAERLLQLLPGASFASPRLRASLQILSVRAEGPGRIGLIGEPGWLEKVSAAGHRVTTLEGAGAAAAVVDNAFELLVIGSQLEPEAALALARKTGELTLPPGVLWASPVDDFEQAVALLRSGVRHLVPRPVDEKGLPARLARALKAQREELRFRALGVLLKEVPLPRSS